MNISNYRALARKYRPKNFSELIGQDALVKTISNAINANKLAQAYLLTGIRGVGKTTTARIIAQTANCENVQIQDGAIPLQCGLCSNCKSFIASNHPDIIEIDAASRTSVDDIRIIIENSEYRPLLGRYKVFIIDEVHMLSKSAFNALLKVLEEPPMHVIFIFATTEVKKIPLTIISRCQRFDLARIDIPKLTHLFLNVINAEGINCDKLALELIASKADGSARDGLSLLDQAIILAGHNNIVSSDIVKSMVGFVSKSEVIEFFSSVIYNKADKALVVIHNIHKVSSDFTEFLNELATLCAYMAKKIALKEHLEIEFNNHEVEICDLVKNINMAWVQIAWQLIFKASVELKITTNQLQLIEMLVLKLIYITSEPLVNKKIKISESQTSESTKTDQSEISNSQTINKQGGNPETAINLIDKQIENVKPSNENNKSLAGEDLRLLNDFLKALSAKNMYDLLHFMLNSVEITQFSANKVSFKGNKADSKLLSDLRNEIDVICGLQPEFSIINSSEFTSIKSSIIENFEASELWQEIEENFNKSKVEDVVINFK